jgi:predicted Kef-type K+ transport protein
MLRLIGIACASIALFFEFSSYYHQIKKTLKVRHSNQVSSSSYLFKIGKISFNLINLAIFANWVGFSMEAAALVICIAALSVIAHFKPKGWRLFHFGK